MDQTKTQRSASARCPCARVWIKQRRHEKDEYWFHPCAGMKHSPTGRTTNKKRDLPHAEMVPSLIVAARYRKIPPVRGDGFGIWHMAHQAADRVFPVRGDGPGKIGRVFWRDANFPCARGGGWSIQRWRTYIVACEFPRAREWSSDSIVNRWRRYNSPCAQGMVPSSTPTSM